MTRSEFARRELLRRELARRSFPAFMEYIHPDISLDRFHYTYYEILDRFAHGHVRKLIITCPPQSGKLLKADTPVLTANRGWVQHGELQAGDYVFSPNGNPVKVVHNFGVYNWKCRQVLFADGYSLIASYNHEWDLYIPNSDHKPIFYHRIETDDIEKNRKDRSPYIPTCLPLNFREFTRPVPLDAYQLGLWLGDGNSCDSKITKTIEDIRYLADCGIVYNDRVDARKDNCAYARLSSISTSDLRKNGLINNKHIPQEYLFASVEDRLALLQGLFDTDGTVDTEGRCEFYNTNKDIADGVAFILRTMGYKPCVRQKKGMLNGVQHKDCYCVSVSPYRDFPLFRLPRKLCRLQNKTAKDRDDKIKHFIRSISGEEHVYGNCIQVEGGMYLAGYELVPTHNSEGSTRNLPAYIHGLNPDSAVCIASYGFPLAEKFNRAIKANMMTEAYGRLFPDTILPKTDRAKELKGELDISAYANNARNYQIIGHKGSLIAVGRGGALTGNPVDIGIVDDLYKDDTEANSPLIRDTAWEWYVDVFSTRLHNNSQQLITFTRWHEDDLIGKIKATCEKEGTPFIEIVSLDQLNNCDRHSWYYINFEAIKETATTEVDPREHGEVLWPERHDLSKLIEQRKLDPSRFQSLYQGNPMPREGLLYTREFRTYRKLPPKSEWRGSFLFCDVADTGSDYLSSLPFIYTRDGKLKFRDILYTQEGTEVTEQKVAEQIIRNGVKTAWIESNSGGTIFARNVKKILAEKHYVCYIYGENQRQNKESRILTHAVDVMEAVEFEEDWAVRYPEFYRDVKGFKKLFKANRHDDGPDSLTGAVEHTVLGGNSAQLYEW